MGKDGSSVSAVIGPRFEDQSTYREHGGACWKKRTGCARKFSLAYIDSSLIANYAAHFKIKATLWNKIPFQITNLVQSERKNFHLQFPNVHSQLAFLCFKKEAIDSTKERDLLNFQTFYILIFVFKASVYSPRRFEEKKKKPRCLTLSKNRPMTSVKIPHNRQQ